MSKSFRTEIGMIPSLEQISIKNKIFTIGSCFSDHIGNLLKRYKFNTTVNPFGIIFNPISLLNLLQHAILNETLPENKIVKSQGMYYHYDLHSEISSATKSSLISFIGEKITSTGAFLKNIDTLMLTFGTAFVYRLKENKEVVANCHKMPSEYFKKELLTSEQIILTFNELYKKLPLDTTIILTVSPVRHIKDTLPLNSVSKSVLRLACHHLSTIHPNVHYFPAYEMMLDDLRDYRFYESDMLHPNSTAIDYIWEQFCKSYITEVDNKFIHKWDKILKAMEHRPFHAYSEENRRFLLNTLDLLKQIKEIDVSKEIKIVENRLEIFNV